MRLTILFSLLVHLLAPVDGIRWLQQAQRSAQRSDPKTDKPKADDPPSDSEEKVSRAKSSAVSEFKTCRKACGQCPVGKTCYAVCEYGCQMYCKQQADPILGCSKKERWTWLIKDEANLDPQLRTCSSDTCDGCPDAYLFDYEKHC